MSKVFVFLISMFQNQKLFPVIQKNILMAQTAAPDLDPTC